MEYLRQRVTRIRDNKGDTLVEVLISLAIISTVLGGAFTVTRTSRLGVRDSQEHSEALQILQGQVDNVREKSTDSTSAIYGTNPFCIDTGGNVDAFSFTTLPDLSSDDFSAYPSQCQNFNSLYNIAAYYDSSQNIFHFSARWDSTRGNRDQVNLVYRIAPAAAISLPPFASCADPAISTEPYYYNFFSLATTDNVTGSDGLPYTPVSFHVWWFHNPPKTFQHPVSLNPFTPSTPIPAGTYNYWAIGKDDSANPGATNRTLHYLLQNSSGTTLATTADTDPNLVFQAISGKYESAVSGVLTLSANATQIKVAHSAKQDFQDPPTNSIPTVDDSVDAGCLALQPKT